MLPAVALALRHEERTVTRAIRASVLDTLPVLASTPELRASFDASLTGNLRAALSILEASADPDTMPIADAQVDFAHLLIDHAADGMPQILSAYRLGQSAFLSAWTQNAARLVTDAYSLADVLRQSTRLLDAYISRSSDIVARSVGGLSVPPSPYDADVVRAVLAEEVPAPERIEDYRLDGRHLAAVATAPGLSIADRERLLSSLRHALSPVLASRRSMGVVADHELWIWFAECGNVGRADSSALVADLLPIGGLMAFGRTLRGPAGFVRSHHQARRVVEATIPLRRPVTWYDDVELEILMGSNPDVASDFVEHELGALGADDESAARLRQTVTVYLEEQGSARRTAERLFLHRNSVVYRIKCAEQLLGREVLARPLALHAALRLAASHSEALAQAPRDG